MNCAVQTEQGWNSENHNILQMLTQYFPDKPLFVLYLCIFCTFIFPLFYLDVQVMSRVTKFLDRSMHHRAKQLVLLN